MKNLSGGSAGIKISKSRPAVSSIKGKGEKRKNSNKDSVTKKRSKKRRKNEGNKNITD